MSGAVKGLYYATGFAFLSESVVTCGHTCQLNFAAGGGAAEKEEEKKDEPEEESDEVCVVYLLCTGLY